LDVELESHRCGGIQIAFWLDLLLDIPERYATSDHKQPALGWFQGSGELVPSR